MADAFDLGHKAQGIFAQNLAYVILRITFAQQSFGDFRNLAGILHAEGHIGTIEIGAQADMVCADEPYGVVDVFDDFAPIDAGEFALPDVFAGDAVALDEFAGFVVAAAPVDLGLDGFVDLGVAFFRVAKFLAEEGDVVVDVDDATLVRQGSDHGVRHVPRGITKRATGGVGGD